MKPAVEPERLLVWAMRLGAALALGLTGLALVGYGAYILGTFLVAFLQDPKETFFFGVGWGGLLLIAPGLALLGLAWKVSPRTSPSAPAP